MDESVPLRVIELRPPRCDGGGLRLGEDSGETRSCPKNGRKAGGIRTRECIEHLAGVRAAGQDGRPFIRTEPGHGDRGTKRRRGLLRRNAQRGARIGEDRPRFGPRRGPQESSPVGSEPAGRFSRRVLERCRIEGFSPVPEIDRVSRLGARGVNRGRDVLERGLAGAQRRCHGGPPGCHRARAGLVRIGRFTGPVGNRSHRVKRRTHILRALSARPPRGCGAMKLADVTGDQQGRVPSASEFGVHSTFQPSTAPSARTSAWASVSMLSNMSATSRSPVTSASTPR